MSSLMPNWGDEDTFMPTPGGILDGLPDYHSASGLDLIMSPEEVAGIDGLGARNGDSNPGQDSRPRQVEARDNSLSGIAVDKFPEQAPPSNGIVEGEYKGPSDPFDKRGEDRASVPGKIWNLPNSAIGMAYGGLGYLAGWPSKWLGLQKDAPGITIGNNAVQFTNNPLGGKSAITLGNAEVFGYQPSDKGGDHNRFGPHEEQHTYQGEQLGPLYLPSNILGGLTGMLIDGEWHGSHNWNEAGPQQHPPAPWPK